MKGKKNDKTVEEKIYEAIGIVYFKKFLLGLEKGAIKLIAKIAREPELANEFSPSGGNYHLNKSKGKDSPKAFRKMLLLNAGIHIFALIACIPKIMGAQTIGAIAWNGFWVALTCYCIMLQRYNGIRIGRFVKKLKERESRQQEKELQSEKEYQVEKTKSLDLSQTNGLYTQQVINSPLQENEEFSLEEQRHQLEQLREFIITSNTLDNKEQAIYDGNNGQARVLKPTNNNF